jgi:hypothetical protein
MPVQIEPIIFVSAQAITLAGQRKDYINHNLNRAPEKISILRQPNRRKPLAAIFLIS